MSGFDQCQSVNQSLEFLKSHDRKFALEIYDHEKGGRVDTLYMNHEFFKAGSIKKFKPLVTNPKNGQGHGGQGHPPEKSVLTLSSAPLGTVKKSF